MRKRQLAYVACVFLTGLVQQRLDVKALFLVVVLILLLEAWYGLKRRNFRRAAGRCLILLSAFLLGSLHMQRELDFREAYMSKIVDGCEVTVWGELIKTEVTEYGNRGFLSDCYISLSEGAIPCNDALMYTSKDHLKIGQIYKITGKVNMFSKARNEGNFDSLSYYQSLKIDFAINEEDCVCQREGTRGWKEVLISLRQKMCNVYEVCLEEKAAGFYQAMVLGDKKNLQESLKDLFLIGGISHILAISGLHVSIIGRGMYGILRQGGLGFGIAGIYSSVLLCFYCFMVGSSTSTVRAVGMMLLFFLAQWIGRSYDMLNSLGVMVLVLLWENPFLIENTGFWFSVTALLGVGIVGHELSSGMQRKKESDLGGRKKENNWFAGLWMSVGITLTTLPVTALSYYEVPLYSPLVNFFVLPLLTPVFALAVVAGLLGAFLHELEIISIMLQPCQWLLDYYEWVCQMVSKFPGSKVICGKPEVWQVVLYYIVLFGGVFLLRIIRMDDTKKTNRNHLFGRRKTVFGITVCICLLCIFLPKPKKFEITFLDVGQGDGVYINAGDGTSFFIDGGSSNVDGVGEYRILPFLKSKGVKSIDYWFVSHTDMDHVSGLLEILDSRYKIKHIILGEQCSTDDNYKDLLVLAENAGVEVLYMEAGDRIRSKNMEVMCLGPIKEIGKTISEDKNENSLILQMEWKANSKGLKALFAGDISTEMEEKLCGAGILEDVDLFKANHHGSNYSNGVLLFENIKPEYIVVSCSEKNTYGHPGACAIERMEACGAKIFYTMENGQITFPLIQ